VTDTCPADTTVWGQIRHRLAQMEASRTASADPAALAERSAKRARGFRDRTAAVAPAGSQVTFLAFNKGRERYGIPLEDVVEVLPLDQFSLVPGAPAFLLGVVHFRGTIVSLLDLGLVLGIPASGLADLHVLIVVEAGGKRIAVAASQVEEILSVPTDQLKPSPGLSGQAPPEWIAGVYDENRMIVRTAQILNDAQFVRWRQDDVSDRRRTDVPRD